ncbi:uncharacterized protein BCR38DRAFT_412650 [Pseudomassariella vexata]|uniref:Uncharacterized protein n=1 Tax=Pseudomassariella vexata TaxID=1141098 RepID=A0A1Y2DK98_9PEZI|nr:uncharacterized protein BCR38DRAFT_412650 [Pseudomassariella vexata]ORY59653.1 hypothetical protein BCR38DRAFT_412650 [Pseudomassariella vexata]
MYKGACTRAALIASQARVAELESMLKSANSYADWKIVAVTTIGLIACAIFSAIAIWGILRTEKRENEIHAVTRVGKTDAADATKTSGAHHIPTGPLDVVAKFYAETARQYPGVKLDANLKDLADAVAESFSNTPTTSVDSDAETQVDEDIDTDSDGEDIHETAMGVLCLEDDEDGSEAMYFEATSEGWVDLEYET